MRKRDQAKEIAKDIVDNTKEPLIKWLVIWPFDNPEKLIFLFFGVAAVYSAFKNFT